MLRIFIGYDPRQPVSYNVLQDSIVANSSQPVAITPLVLKTLPITRKSLTEFTFSRFLVPYLCNYEGWGLFLDADIVLRGDIAELFNFANDQYAVMVSKNVHKFEWASVMLFNCAKNKILTPEYVDDVNTQGLHGINWCDASEVGELPGEWNHLVGYDPPRSDAKLVHYTQGVPYFEETARCEYAPAWLHYHKHMNSSVPWVDFMGTSVHTKRLANGRVVPKLYQEGT